MCTPCPVPIAHRGCWFWCWQYHVMLCPIHVFKERSARRSAAPPSSTRASTSIRHQFDPPFCARFHPRRPSGSVSRVACRVVVISHPCSVYGADRLTFGPVVSEIRVLGCSRSRSRSHADRRRMHGRWRGSRTRSPTRWRCTATSTSFGTISHALLNFMPVDTRARYWKL